MLTQQILKKSAFIHLGIWITYAMLANKRIIVTSPATWSFWSIVLTYLLFALTFYFTSLVLLPGIIEKKKYLLFGTLGCLYLIFFIAADYVIENWVEVVFYHQPPLNMSLEAFAFTASWYFLRYSIFGAGYYFLNRYFAELKKKSVLDELRYEQQIQLGEIERKNLALENTLLRAQINPHFVFNTLGYIRRRVRLNENEQAEKAILSLADIMRYSFRPEDPDGKVFLSEELHHIGQFIQNHEMRYGGEQHIIYTVTGNPGKNRIPAHTLLTLVENTYRHGDHYQPNHPTSITCNIEENSLTFMVSNRKARGKPMPGGGLGMRYLKQRLQMVYNEGFSLNVNENDEQYTVKLTLTI